MMFFLGNISFLGCVVGSSVVAIDWVDGFGCVVDGLRDVGDSWFEFWSNP